MRCSTSEAEVRGINLGRGEKEKLCTSGEGEMANRGKGHGPRPRNLEEDWADWGGGGWNQFPIHPYPPHQAPPLPFFNPPPPQLYGFYPNQVQQPHLQHPPPQFFDQQFNGPRPRGGGVADREQGEVMHQQAGNRLGLIRSRERESLSKSLKTHKRWPWRLRRKMR